MRSNDHAGLVAAIAGAWFVASMAFFFSIGPCVEQEDVRVKVDHLERRLDNIADKR